MLKKFYIIGDSHVNFFSGNEKISFSSYKYGINKICSWYRNIAVYHFGPALAYNSNKYNTKTKAKEKVEYLIKNGNLPRGANLICCFGEIDLRSHVLKYSQDINNNIDTVLINYEHFLVDLEARGYKIYCWGPIASMKDVFQ